LAEDTRIYLKFLDHDPAMRRYAQKEPQQWQEIRPCLLRLGWQTYLERWEGMYRKQAPFLQWVKSAFALPYIPEYYRLVRAALWYGIRERVIVTVKRALTQTKSY
jgi:hypothetical protein